MFQVGEEVTCRPVLLVLEAARRRRVPFAGLFDGTGLDSDRVADPITRISWSAFVRFLSNANLAIGESGIVGAGRGFPTSELARPLLGRAVLLADPADLYRIAAQPDPGFFAIDFACIRVTLREPGPGKFEFELRTAEGYAPCPEFHALMRGLLEGLPGIVGFPRATVAVEPTLEGARFNVSLPSHPDGLLARLRHGLRRLRIRRVPSRQLGWALLEIEARSQQLARALEDQERIRSARADSEERFTKIFHASPAPVSLMRVSDGVLADINEAYLTFVGLRREDVIGIRAREAPWCTPAEIERIEEAWERDPHLRDFPYRIQRPDGEVRHGLLSGQPVSVDGEPHVIWQVADVTDRERAADVLREAEQTYFDLYENAPDMYVLVDLDSGHIRRCNRKLCETLGVARASLEGTPVVRFLESDPPERLGKVLEHLRVTGSLRNVRLRMRRERGDAFEVSVSGSAVRSPDGKVRQTRLIVRNLSRADEAPGSSESS